MLSVLLGTVIGGVVALSTSLALELRRERRSQIAAARAVVSQLRRSSVELEVLRDVADEPWLEGPHAAIKTDAWFNHAALFVGRLKQAQFESVDRTHRDLAAAGDFGFSLKDAARLVEQKLEEAEQIIEPLTAPTWFDRHVWRL